MPSYEVSLERNAVKALRRVPAKTRQRIVAAIDALAGEPRPHGHKTLDAKKKLYRVRVGRYRVVYQVHDDRLVVLVVRLGDRKDVYARLNELRKSLTEPDEPPETQ